MDELQNLMRSRPGNWVFFGDFNIVRRAEERFNSVFCPKIAKAFNSFISGSGLLHLNI